MKKTNAARILDRANIEYEIIDYDVDPIELGAERVAEKTGQHIQHIYKTLVLSGDKTGVIVACIPGSSELNLKSIAQISKNKKCAMVPMKNIQEITGYIRGGCSPIGMKKDFPLFIDETAFSLEFIFISAGLRGKQIKINPADLQSVTKATVSLISNPKTEAHVKL
ncbi:Cys-tRNA(Pro) deacylase [Marinifilum sp. RC60d5]|uniref:Cys-tRNA(Pro) deacylase n=1 Tax=Marinifilum sp. RC60d5 TaxID=3458414 RepID=UPI004035AFF3